MIIEHEKGLIAFRIVVCCCPVLCMCVMKITYIQGCTGCTVDQANADDAS